MTRNVGTQVSSILCTLRLFHLVNPRCVKNVDVYLYIPDGLRARQLMLWRLHLFHHRYSADRRLPDCELESVTINE